MRLLFVALPLSLALANTSALGQPIGTFDAPFNHRNSYPGVTYNHPVTDGQWQNARNDPPPRHARRWSCPLQE